MRCTKKKHYAVSVPSSLQRMARRQKLRSFCKIIKASTFNLWTTKPHLQSTQSYPMMVVRFQIFWLHLKLNKNVQGGRFSPTVTREMPSSKKTFENHSIQPRNWITFYIFGTMVQNWSLSINQVNQPGCFSF